MKPRVTPRALPRVSTHAVNIFAAYGRLYMRRRFHTIRILKCGQPPRGVSRPLVIYLNHASWWDPLVCLYLSRKAFPDRISFAPIDAASLKRYRFFKHIGMYGIEQQSVRGALQFLRTTRTILGAGYTAVWLTPQGGFFDVRERPLRIRRGLGTLAARTHEVEFLPLAIEYTFWTEPRPEILLAFGEAIVPSREEARTAEEWTVFFAGALEAAQDELASRSCRRDPSDWLVLEKGACGVSLIYDAWRMIRARLSGAAFAREHRPETWA
jgi:1-acyl-sn-glycerol-3-phosphate acyltransferase